MSMAYLTFFTGIAISLVAIYYSVMGLTAIFAAAVVPIVIMGTILEVAKLVTTVWLKQNWKQAPISLKAYLSVAVLVLMLITSMGIFGFLSKAHLDQGVPTGDVAAKVALLDEKIKTERDNIDASRKALAQMDASFEQTMSRSSSEQGADKAVAIRKSQAKERAALQKDIAAAQTNITKLNEERAPIASELRKVEAEVGPIKYIAALIYGDNPDQNILEKAVTWVIITIIFVFDPLAVLLLLASQYSFAWSKKAEGNSLTTESGIDIVEEATVTQPIDVGNATYRGYRVEDAMARIDEEIAAEEANQLLSEIEKEAETEIVEELPQPLSSTTPTLEDPVTVPKTKKNIMTRIVGISNEELSNPSRFGIKTVHSVSANQDSVTETKEPNEIIFPADPFLGQQITLEDRAFIYNGSTWVESPLSQEHQTALERPGDYVQNSEQTSDSLWNKLKKSNDTAN